MLVRLVVKYLGFALFLTTFGLIRSANGQSPPLQLAAHELLVSSFENRKLELGVSVYNGGAIDHLSLDGFEYINAHDRGRELQSAISFDGQGECANPTEAGSRDDHSGGPSSSVVSKMTLIGNQIRVHSLMAPWISADVSKCRNYTIGNTEAHLSKSIYFGGSDFPNVIVQDRAIMTATSHVKVTVEAITAYMTSSMDTFWKVHPISYAAELISGADGEQIFPLIASSRDKDHALGLLAYLVEPESHSRMTFGHFSFINLSGADNAVTKLNVVTRFENDNAKFFHLRCYTIIGSLEQVASTMARLDQSFKAGRHLP